MTRLILLAAAVALTGAAAPHDADAFIKGSLRLTRYKAASVDLNDDRVREVLVYANGPEDCGSGGCDLYLLTKDGQRYRVVTKFSVTRLPVRILPTSSHGWHNLGVQVAGGGITTRYEARLAYNGATYPDNPTVPPAQPLSKSAGRVVLK